MTIIVNYVAKPANTAKNEEAQAARDHAVRRETIKLLPSQTKLQLIRDSVVAQDMDWLEALAEGGAFDFVLHDENDQLQRHFHNKENPLIAALAEITTTTKLRKYTFDVYTGETFDSNSCVDIASVPVNNPYFEFFGRRVQAFAREARNSLDSIQESVKSWVSENGKLLNENALKRVRTESNFSEIIDVTAGVLMGAAAAMNDAASIRLLGKEFPKAKDTLLSPLILGRKQDPEGDAPEWVNPAAVALWFGSREALDALHEVGWRASDKVTHVPAQHFLASPVMGSGAVESHTAIGWTVKNVSTLGMFTLPSSIERVLERVDEQIRKENLLRPEGVLDSTEALPLEELQRQRMELAEITVRGRDHVSLMPALARTGVLDIGSSTLAIAAAQACNFKALNFLVDKIDWSRWDLPSQPGPVPWEKEFPPVALALMSDVAPNGIDTDAELAKLCRACIDAGYGRLLAVSQGASAPVRVMASRGLSKSMLLCLEQGADPSVSPPSGVNGQPGFNAIFLAGQSDETDRVMRSFLARRAAQDAISDCLAPGAFSDSSGGARPSL